MPRANIIGLGSDESPEPEDVEERKENVLGLEDTNNKNVSTNKFLIDANKNTKPRRVSRGPVTAPID